MPTWRRVQESSLTGESGTVLKDAAALPGPAGIGDRLDMVFKGTTVAQGIGRAVVTATGMNTQMGSIAQMLEATKEEPTPLQKDMLSHAADTNADLIVMGAYGHSRWAERVLGDATRGLLASMTVPVLMSH